MLLVNSFIVVTIYVVCCSCYPQNIFNRRFRRLPMQQALKLKLRLQEKLNQYRQRNTQTVCYDLVGCFDMPHSRSPLQKVPEDPASLSTKFYLFRRNINFSHPEIIYYDDNGKSLKKSRFDNKQPLKLVIHGYMSKWDEKGAIVIADAYLKIDDCNVILMDWVKAARGPHYTTAAANTELAGRQLGILLLKMIENGLNAKNIHLTGFSLGAHVAGSASELLKREGHLISRITGLDPAGPLFRNNYLREKHKKLDREDADFVDVIHTDSSPFATDGFGLWEPIGHVDFYPNGGQDQPGCTDTRGSIVVSQFGPLDEEITCSHLRAWHLFQESLVNQAQNKTDGCQFISFSCAGGLPTFEKGLCFPQLENPLNPLAVDVSYRSDIGIMGNDARGEGVMYLSTTGSKPFCGTQLQASVQISQKTLPSRGILSMQMMYDGNTVDFEIKCEILDFIMTGTIMNGIGVAKHNTLQPTKDNINTKLTYYDLEYAKNSDKENSTTISRTPMLYIDRISVRDMYGHSWHFCSKDTVLQDKTGDRPEGIFITLSRRIC